MRYRGMGRAQLDAAYNNTAAVPERGAIVADWAQRSARVRQERAGRLDLSYGNSPRERLDLFIAAEPKTPTLAFIHGGYWQMNDKEDFAFLAEGLLPLGINAGLLAGAGRTVARGRAESRPPRPQRGLTPTPQEMPNQSAAARPARRRSLMSKRRLRRRIDFGVTSTSSSSAI